MPTLTLIQYILQLFIAEHEGHTQTRRVGPAATVYYDCSCGVTLELPSSK